jgi:uncharacterized membrane protein YphA (DoxX/SURF4 family)
MLKTLLRKSLAVEPSSPAAIFGHLLFRVSAGLMVFYIHGLHKLEGWIAYVQNGTPWELLKEVEGMHFPAPYPSAITATLIQFICSIFIIMGLFTRVNAVLLLGALSGAILQNLLAGRSPQLALLYILIVITLAFIGGGKFSLDAKLASKLIALNSNSGCVHKLSIQQENTKL